MSKASLVTVLRGIVIMALFGYFSSRVYIAFSKLQEGRIGTLFNRITSATVKVNWFIRNRGSSNKDNFT